MIEAAKPGGHDQYPGLREIHHELQFALPKDRHQRIADRAQLETGQMNGDEFPPVGQLKGHHFAGAHTYRSQAGGDPVRARVEFAVAQRMADPALRPIVHHRGAIRSRGHRGFKVFEQITVPPPSGSPHFMNPLRGKHRVWFHY